MPHSRYKLTIAYRGTRYHGWQTQLASQTWKGPAPPAGEEHFGIPTIQGILNKAMGGVLGHPVTLIGSSRTDAGVHAKGQVAHFDTSETQIPTDGLRRAVNARLPEDVLLRSIEPARPDFDSIGDTICKRYQYLVWNADDRPVMFPDLAWHRWQPLDVDAMHDAAQRLVGTYDFTSFARPGHGKESTIRTVTECSVSYRPPKLVLGIAGSGFLWNMIRIMVGALVEVGLERYRPEEMEQMLAARDRRSAGSTAPPHGLYLHWIRFRDHDPSTSAGKFEYRSSNDE